MEQGSGSVMFGGVECNGKVRFSEVRVELGKVLQSIGMVRYCLVWVKWSVVWWW